jgi:hypothetical protein
MEIFHWISPGWFRKICVKSTPMLKTTIKILGHIHSILLSFVGEVRLLDMFKSLLYVKNVCWVSQSWVRVSEVIYISVPCGPGHVGTTRSICKHI